MKMSKTSPAKYLVLSKELSSGEIIDHRIIIHFKPLVWAKLEGYLALNAKGSMPRLKYSYFPYGGIVQHLKTNLILPQAEISCEVRLIDTHIEVCLYNGDFEHMKRYANSLMSVAGKYVMPTGVWNLLCELPPPEEASYCPRFR